MLPTLANSKTRQSQNDAGHLSWQSSARTHVGMVRKINEDAIFSNKTSGIWAVADGMGGHEAGEIASQMIIHALDNLQSTNRLSEFVEHVDTELQAVNRRIQQHSNTILEGRTLGSTVVTLIVRGNIGACLWAGDSRLYQLRDGNLARVSKDHSKVEELIDQGELLREEADSHPESNVITRAVGACADLYLGNCIFDVEPGDTFLLCSDGLYNSVGNDDIKTLIQHADIDQCAQSLIDRSLENNANDNVSAIVVRATKPLG
ncbi:MAG: protein phosphatase 2C domain-containing protein [Gammaproteobacteria bacterium]|jgi:protein phosphatase